MTTPTCVNTDLSQLPANLPLYMTSGNDFSFTMNWGADMTGYAFTAFINPIGKTATEIPITVTPISVVLGTYRLTITKTSITGLGLNVNHNWYINWVTPSTATPASLTRTIVAGTFMVKEK